MSYVMHQSLCVTTDKVRNMFDGSCVYLCCRKVCTMLLLMILRVSHTNMATMFLVRALEKLSLGTATAPPVAERLVLLSSRPRGSAEVEFSITDICSSRSEET